MAQAGKISVVIVDDHPLFRDALTLAIKASYPAAAIKEAPSIDTAKDMMSRGERFDLVLLDLSMPGVAGFEGFLELRSIDPKQPIVIVSALEDSRIIHEAVTLGAAGFIPKSARKPELAEAIESVMQGNLTLPKTYQPPARDPAGTTDIGARLSSLTPQQLRVLNMLRQGLLNKQIAHELGVGETTVKAHVSEILRKLDVASRTQAVIEVSRIDFIGPYSQAGLLESDPIQFPAELDQGAIAAGGDVRDDRAHDRIDLGRCLALGGEKGTEALGESRRAAVETDRHGPVLPGRTGRIGGTDAAGCCVRLNG